MVRSIKEKKKVLVMKKRERIGFKLYDMQSLQKAYHEIDYYQSMLLHWCSFVIGEFLNWCLCGLFSFFCYLLFQFDGSSQKFLNVQQQFVSNK